MDTEQMSTLFALLSLGSLALAAAVGVAALVVRDRAQRAQLVPALVPLALLVAASAMGGSLYYSEVAGFRPCEFCWYQRIAMYPLVPVLAVGLARRDPGVGWYGLPLAVAGAGLAVYHYQLQLFPEQSSSCDPVAPCTAQFVDEFGFVSIPFMALSGFLAVGALLALHLWWTSGREHP